MQTQVNMISKPAGSTYIMHFSKGKFCGRIFRSIIFFVAPRNQVSNDWTTSTTYPLLNSCNRKSHGSDSTIFTPFFTQHHRAFTKPANKPTPRLLLPCPYRIPGYLTTPLEYNHSSIPRPRVATVYLAVLRARLRPAARRAAPATGACRTGTAPADRLEWEISQLSINDSSQ